MSASRNVDVLAAEATGHIGGPGGLGWTIAAIMDHLGVDRLVLDRELVACPRCDGTGQAPYVADARTGPVMQPCAETVYTSPTVSTDARKRGRVRIHVEPIGGDPGGSTTGMTRAHVEQAFAAGLRQGRSGR